MATKSDKSVTSRMLSFLIFLVTYNEEFPSIKSQDPFIKWFCKAQDKLNTLYFYYHKAYYGH